MSNQPDQQDSNQPQGQPPSQTRGIGRGMIVAAWVLVLALMTMFFNSWLEKQQNPNQNPFARVDDQGVREIKLIRNRGGHYVMNGRINGETVVFLLDTGATDVVLPQQVADQLGLDKGQPYTVSTANGYITVYATRLDRIELGTIVLNDVRASINPHMDSKEILLGMTALKQLELLQQGKTLTLKQY